MLSDFDTSHCLVKATPGEFLNAAKTYKKVKNNSCLW